GKETGEFIAVDADTGKIVWQFQTGSGINAIPVTYTHQGRQYVTVLSGIGGLYWNIARERLKDKVPQGGSVWTFALLPEGRPKALSSALTGRTHGCTDHPANVKKSLAKSEPSTHGTKRTYRGKRAMSALRGEADVA